MKNGGAEWMESLYAAVAVEDTIYHFDRPFTYFVPHECQPLAKPGCRVLVPFGSGSRTRQGIILSLTHGDEQGKDTKGILAVLDREPVLDEERLLLTSWMKEHYFCTLYDAAKAMLPSGLHMRLRRGYVLTEKGRRISREEPSSRSGLSVWQRRIVRLLGEKSGPMEQGAFLRALNLTAEAFDLKILLEQGMVEEVDLARRKVGDATRKMVQARPLPEGVKLTPRQKEVYATLQEVGAVYVKELCYFTGAGPTVVEGLVKKGAAFYYEEEVYRIPAAPEIREETKETVLTPSQQKAFEELLLAYREKAGGTSLLYGITGSGKTLVFLELIRAVLRDRRGVILMVPEISLTPQIVTRFRAAFGEQVAVFHSGLSDGERTDEWKRVRRGLAKVVVGTRSAVFAPLSDIGLILLDEEQESTYKSEQSPRYHAREVAQFRCKYHRALCVLVSATPSIETRYRAQKGYYGYSSLGERYGTAVLPKVTVVDMNGEALRGNRSAFSTVLQEKIAGNLQKGEQSILLLNRRGYHTFASCTACGEVVTCPNCSISMTYHSANHRLVCHYCGTSLPFTTQCGHCGEHAVRFSGAGTQRGEEELQQLFPKARVLRLDTDTTMVKDTLQKKLTAFSRQEYDILLGTQMVAKGLDFPHVTLVGVLNADQTLYSDDFRSSERAFDLLTQVVGRSGRGQYPGIAVIQTHTPENPIFTLAALQDYETFYQQEIRLRQALLYPPFADLLVLGFVGTDERKVRLASAFFFRLLQETASARYPELPLRVLSPSPASILKVSGKYRYKLLIKCRLTRGMREMTAELLCRYAQEKEYRDVTVYADSNPDTIL